MRPRFKIVTNHWGWSLRGLRIWYRFGWAKPFETWGIEVSGRSPRRFRRRAKVGPLSFDLGTYSARDTGEEVDHG